MHEQDTGHAHGASGGPTQRGITPSHWAPSLTMHTIPDTTQAPANRSCEQNVQLRTQRCDGTHAAEPDAQRGGRHKTHRAVATPTRSAAAQGHRSGRRRLQLHQWRITSTKEYRGTGPQRRTLHRSKGSSMITVVCERSGAWCGEQGTWCSLCVSMSLLLRLGGGSYLCLCARACSVASRCAGCVVRHRDDDRVALLSLAIMYRCALC
jgi:hypothetical protein